MNGKTQTIIKIIGELHMADKKKIYTVETVHLYTVSDINEKAFQLYSQSFPDFEQRTVESQKAVLNNKDYRYNLIYDADKFIGLILFWKTDEFIYVEHFCILEEFRGLGYGSKTLDFLKKSNKTIILEIDVPVDEISLKRKHFYEKAGFVENHFAHFHPPYKSNYSAHRLLVMSCPFVLNESQYKEFYNYLCNTVMQDGAE